MNSIDSDSYMGVVSLTVSNLAQSLDYYQHVIGLQVQQQDGRSAVLGAGGEALLILRELAESRPSQSPHTGLFHFALLLPSRRDLALVLRHLISLNLDRLGASDHAVSEALYLDDPDGHGIEIYADRPRDRWSVVDGQLRMGTERMNVSAVLAEIGEADLWSGLPEGTTMGHVHLRVGNLAEAKRFYVDLLGFDLMVDYGGQASFVSAGGYHHHLGMNIWGSAGAAPAPSDVAALDYFTVCVPDVEAQAAIAARIQENGGELVWLDDRCFFADPFQNRIALTVADRR